MRISKVLFALFSVCLVALTLPLQSAAQDMEAVTMPPAYADLADSLPPEISDLLPDGLFSESLEEALTATAELTDWRYLLNALLSAVGLRLDAMVGLLCTLIGLILLAAVLGRLREGLGSSGEIPGFCLRLTLYTAIVVQTAGTVETVRLFYDRLTTLTGGMIPVMGALYALGGNMGRAAVNAELLMVFLAVCQYISTTVTPPVCAVCMSFSLMDALGVKLTLAPLGDRIKKWYASLLGLVMFFLSLALSTRSVLAGRGDTLGMRGVKYAVGNMIPMVGGAVAGTLSTVAAGVTALRGICGVSGIILVALLLLPTLVELLLTRALLNLSATVASMLSCDGEAKLLSEMASLHGYLAAAASICAVVFMIALTLLIHSGTALA
jgi:stage III sporulation protein AE